MSILKNGEDIINDLEALAQHVVNYFPDLYASNNNCMPNNLIQNVIPLSYLLWSVQQAMSY